MRLLFTIQLGFLAIDLIVLSLCSDSYIYEPSFTQSCLKLTRSFSLQIDEGMIVLKLFSIHKVVSFVQLLIISSICESPNILCEISKVLNVDKATSKGVGRALRFLLR